MILVTASCQSTWLGYWTGVLMVCSFLLALFTRMRPSVHTEIESHSVHREIIFYVLIKYTENHSGKSFDRVQALLWHTVIGLNI